MEEPLRITAICCTYARVDHLVEALACFLKQDWPNKRMVILNTCPEQTLEFSHPEVKIINEKNRPATMGATRNLAIEHADEGLLVTWDDDDLYLEKHMANFALGFDPEKHGWSKHNKQFYMESLSLRGVSHGTANVFSYTKKAWREVSKFGEINVGEDQNFCGKVSSKFEGVFVTLDDSEVSMVYRWATGCHHLSGQGQDKPGLQNSMERYRAWADEQLNCGREPRGVVKLVPKLLQDYEKLAANFTGSVKKLVSRNRGKVNAVCLGHAGDLLNILPCMKWIADRWQKPTVFTSRMYGAVLEGASYVNVELLDLPDSEINKAVEIAKQRSEIVIIAQQHGDNFHVDRVCESYNVESWKSCGLLEHFHNTVDFPLVLDRRDLSREQRLADTLPMKGNPVMLVNVTGGLSSPWNDGSKMLGWILNHFQQQFCIIDLAQVRAERIYDILGLLDRAAVLITSDTYTVHLATASKVPVIAILNDNTQPFGRPWLRSKPRYKALLELNYSDAMNRTGEIREAVGKIC